MLAPVQPQCSPILFCLGPFQWWSRGCRREFPLCATGRCNIQPPPRNLPSGLCIRWRLSDYGISHSLNGSNRNPMPWKIMTTELNSKPTPKTSPRLILLQRIIVPPPAQAHPMTINNIPKNGCRDGLLTGLLFWRCYMERYPYQRSAD
jgi:hypothetical protein